MNLHGKKGLASMGSMLFRPVGDDNNNNQKSVPGTLRYGFEVVRSGAKRCRLVVDRDADDVLFALLQRSVTTSNTSNWMDSTYGAVISPEAPSCTWLAIVCSYSMSTLRSVSSDTSGKNS